MQPRNELAEAIGLVAVAASHADAVVRECVGILGGPGARLLADEQASVSRLLSWCDKFATKLFEDSHPHLSELRDCVANMKRLLEQRNRVIHGIWFQKPETDLQLSARRSGKNSYRSETFTPSDVLQLAQDLKNTTWDLHVLANRVAFPSEELLWPRHGDVC